MERKKYNINWNLIFSGEVLKEKRNANGKKYRNNQLIFEGIYLNNQKKRGKVYFDSKLEFEGEYLDDKKWYGNDMMKIEI